MWPLCSDSQKLAKQELMGYPDNQLLRRLDDIVTELASGEGSYGLGRLPDEGYRAAMGETQRVWEELLTEIARVREGTSGARLYELSEEMYTLADNAYAEAEDHCRRQLAGTVTLLVITLAAFVLFVILAIFFRQRAGRRRPPSRRDAVGDDPLTGLPGRAGCERYIARHAARPTGRPMAVLVFDMNNLSLINDQLGHKGGDEVIRDFAAILRAESAAAGSSFAGRWGGDEFLIVLEDAGSGQAADLITAVNEKVVANNLLRLTEAERISFAAGYAAGGDLHSADLAPLVEEADRRMLARKRQMRENRHS